MNTADVIVIGLGGMGSATVLELAHRGARVLGFDQFAPPHSYGSSHGLSRMYRQAYWEDARYVPMLRRAFDLWHQLDEVVGGQLFHVTGGLVIGDEQGELVTRSLESARHFHLPHRMLDTEELRRRYPLFRLKPGTIALLEENAGYVVPELAIKSQLEQAQKAGATLRTTEQVLAWKPEGDSVIVRTTQGTYSAGHVVITAGPWAGELMAELQMPLRVTRQVLYWFQPRAHANAFAEGQLPVYLFEADPGEPILYGFPRDGCGERGVKVALHGSNDACTPHSVKREIDSEDERRIRTRLEATLPDLAGELLHAETCLYTMTPDEHFIIDRHPQSPQVTIAAGFSGHGFKFTPVVGEALSDLALQRSTAWDLGLFSLARFGPLASPSGDGGPVAQKEQAKN